MKRETVKIVATANIYGSTDYSVTDLDGLVYRSGIGSRETAKKIAERIDLENTDPAYRGWGGLDLS